MDSSLSMYYIFINFDYLFRSKNVRFFEIGNVVEKQHKNDCVELLLDKNTKCLSMEDIENKCFQHFE